MTYFMIGFSFFGGFDFFGGGHRHGERETPKGGDVVVDLFVSLEEMYNGNFIEVCQPICNSLNTMYSSFTCDINWK